MRKFYPLILILTILIFFWKTILQGLLPIPSDTIIGLYHPFRDLYAKNYPNGIPFKNFLITDPVRQLYPWKNLVISAEKNFQLPLWNPYSFAGYPLLANFQSGAFYPLNILFLFLPFSTSWSVLIILQPLLGGLFLYFYLKNLKVHPFASLIAAISFAFCGFSIAWLEWGNVLQTIIWVPLVLLAKDKLLEKWSWKWTFIFFFSETSAFFAGHLQILFYALIITNIYLFLRVFQKAQKIEGNIFTNYNRIYFPFLLVGLVMYAATAFQWIPTLKFILLSARSVDQNYLNTQGWFIPWQNLIQFIIPDFFGNPSTLNYFGVWNYGEFVGYIGIIPLIFSLFAIFFRRDKKTLFFYMLLLIALIFALPTPIAKIPFILNIPFISTAQPTRLMAIIDFCLIILSGLGIDYFLKKENKKIFGILALISVTFLGIWFYVLRFHAGISFENSLVSRQNLYLPTAIFIVAVILISGLVLFGKNKTLKALILSLFFCITVFDLFRFGWKFTPFTKNDYLFPQTKTISFLQKNIGNYRYMTTDSRIMAPNFSNEYKLQSVDGYDPLFLKNYAQLISASERNKPDISEPFGFNRIVTPHNYGSKLVDLLGVKYVLSLTDISDKKLKKVFQEGETRVYENSDVIKRAFFVSNVQYVANQQEVVNLMFDKAFNPEKTALITNPINSKLSESSSGSAQIVNYQDNKITISTQNNSNGFMVLTDIYYPTWTATVDGKQTQIFETDFALRGIVVPKGSHTIEFSDHLF